MEADAALPFTREVCLKCLRATHVCFCRELRPFASQPLFVILINPKERRKRTGTARMAHLCISNSLLFEGVDFSRHERVNALLENPHYLPLLLYPDELAQTATPAVMSEILARGRTPLIFVVDGTWGGARTMLRLSPNLRALPRVSFKTEGNSRFRIRQQPAPGCFSTIEAIHFVLEGFQPGGGHQNLLEVFDWAIEKQCSFSEPGTAIAVRGVRRSAYLASTRGV